ncbi:hypothetical protein ACQ86N_01390 [Puia sp. P3]|uniref:hypothetical protein n=1 Tax=Puia sp. P3 TaxID=3423952 RepID=UPI003D66DEC7
MDEKNIIAVNTSSFKSFIFHNRRNHIILWIAVSAIVIQFAVFKFFYPYASYIHGDSFAYLETAEKNLSINTYMIGYSMFLRAFSAFTNSDTLLVAFQYLSLQASALFLLFTLFYLYNPGKIIQIILFCFMVINPLFLYLGNVISSDALFAALSVTWFSLLLWIIHRPSSRLIACHTAVIFISFTFRYNALIYILISIIAFTLSRQIILKKLIGITAAGLSIGLFILHTGNLFQQLTGNWQYSPFAGWQLANNAMYAYRYVDSADRSPVPKRFRNLDNMIRTYFDNTRDTAKYPIEKIMASTFYMWSPRLPLYQYRETVAFKGDTISSELKKWASMGPIYKDYGLYIIWKYPKHYARYFLWPNSQKYYAPPVEFLESYNSDRDSVAPIAQAWFHYKTGAVNTRTRGKKITMLNFYPILSGVINVVMLFALLSFAMLGGFNKDTKFRKGVFLAGMLWLLNAGFTIFASSAALRFQVFPILLSMTFMSLLIDWLAQMATVKQDIKPSPTTDLSTTLPA